jgi:hypothetical protein
MEIAPNKFALDMTALRSNEHTTKIISGCIYPWPQNFGVGSICITAEFGQTLDENTLSI